MKGQEEPAEVAPLRQDDVAALSQDTPPMQALNAVAQVALVAGINDASIGLWKKLKEDVSESMYKIIVEATALEAQFLKDEQRAYLDFAKELKAEFEHNIEIKETSPMLKGFSAQTQTRHRKLNFELIESAPFKRSRIRNAALMAAHCANLKAVCGEHISDPALSLAGFSRRCLDWEERHQGRGSQPSGSQPSGSQES